MVSLAANVISQRSLRPADSIIGPAKKFRAANKVVFLNAVKFNGIVFHHFIGCNFHNFSGNFAESYMASFGTHGQFRQVTKTI